MINSYGELVKSLETKKLIIFGAGRYFSEFSFWYQELLERTECILDSQYEREDFLRLENSEIVVIPPRMVTRYDMSKYTVLFCSRYAAEMKEQLDRYVKEEYEYYTYPLFTLDEPMGDKNVIARVIDPVIK